MAILIGIGVTTFFLAYQPGTKSHSKDKQFDKPSTAELSSINSKDKSNFSSESGAKKTREQQLAAFGKMVRFFRKSKKEYRDTENELQLAQDKHDDYMETIEKEIGSDQLEKMYDIVVAAQKHRRQKDYEKALVEYQKLIDIAPNSIFGQVQAPAEMAPIYARMGEFEKALSLIEDCKAHVAEDLYNSDGMQVAPLIELQKAEICVRAGDNECLKQVKDTLKNEYPEALFKNGQTVYEFLQSQLETIPFSK